MKYNCFDGRPCYNTPIQGAKFNEFSRAVRCILSSCYSAVVILAAIFYHIHTFCREWTNSASRFSDRKNCRIRRQCVGYTNHVWSFKRSNVFPFWGTWMRSVKTHQNISLDISGYFELRKDWLIRSGHFSLHVKTQ